MALQKKKRNITLKYKYKKKFLKKFNKVSLRFFLKHYFTVLKKFRNIFKTNFFKLNIFLKSKAKIRNLFFFITNHYNLNNYITDLKYVIWNSHYLINTKFIFFLINFYDNFSKFYKSKNIDSYPVSQLFFSNSINKVDNFFISLVLKKLKFILKYFFFFFEYFSISSVNYFFIFLFNNFFKFFYLLNNFSKKFDKNILNFSGTTLFSKYLKKNKVIRKAWVFFFKRTYREKHERIYERKIKYIYNAKLLRLKSKVFFFKLFVLKKLYSLKSLIFFIKKKKLNIFFFKHYFSFINFSSVSRLVYYPSFFLSKIILIEGKVNFLNNFFSSNTFLLPKKNFFLFKDINSFYFEKKFSVNVSLINLFNSKVLNKIYRKNQKQRNYNHFFKINNFNVNEMVWSFHIIFIKKKITFYNNLNFINLIIKKKSLFNFLKIQKIRLIFFYLVFILSPISLYFIWINAFITSPNILISEKELTRRTADEEDFLNRSFFLKVKDWLFNPVGRIEDVEEEDNNVFLNFLEVNKSIWNLYFFKNKTIYKNFYYSLRLRNYNFFNSFLKKGLNNYKFYRCTLNNIKINKVRYLVSRTIGKGEKSEEINISSNFCLNNMTAMTLKKPYKTFFKIREYGYKYKSKDKKTILQEELPDLKSKLQYFDSSFYEYQHFYEILPTPLELKKKEIIKLKPKWWHFWTEDTPEKKKERRDGRKEARKLKRKQSKKYNVIKLQLTQKYFKRIIRLVKQKKYGYDFFSSYYKKFNTKQTWFNLFFIKKRLNKFFKIKYNFFFNNFNNYYFFNNFVSDDKFFYQKFFVNLTNLKKFNFSFKNNFIQRLNLLKINNSLKIHFGKFFKLKTNNFSFNKRFNFNYYTRKKKFNFNNFNKFSLFNLVNSTFSFQRFFFENKMVDVNHCNNFNQYFIYREKISYGLFLANFKKELFSQKKFINNRIFLKKNFADYFNLYYLKFNFKFNFKFHMFVYFFSYNSNFNIIPNKFFLFFLLLVFYTKKLKILK